jgi:predicted transposase YdaD
MADHWDFLLKNILRESPQQFISWILKGAILREALSVEFKRKSIYADALFRVVICGQEILLHLEIQSRKHRKMAERLLEYSVQAYLMHGLPVYSVVIYLRKTAKVPESPLIWKLPNGQVVLRFNFLNIELWKLSPRAILQEGLDGLLPLVFFTEGAEQPEVFDEVMERLKAAHNEDLASLAYVLASLIFADETGQAMVKRRFAMLEDLDLEKSWAYQEILKKGVKQGIEKGIEQGIEKGIEQGIEKEQQKWLTVQRDALFNVVQTRFPELLVEARKKADRTKDPQILLDVMLKVVTAKNSQEARNLLSQ